MRSLAVALIVLVSACGSSTDTEDSTAQTSSVEGLSADAPDPSGSESPASESSTPATERLQQIAAHVDAWGDSTVLEDARVHAEAAANMIVGPGGLG